MQVVSHCVRVVRVSSQYGVGTGEPLQDVVVADSQEVGGLGGDILSTYPLVPPIRSLSHTLSFYVRIYPSSTSSVTLTHIVLHIHSQHTSRYTLSTHPPSSLPYTGVVGESIVYADVCQAWVALLTSSGSVFVLEYDASDESLLLRYSGRRKDDENQTNGDAMQIDKEGNTPFESTSNTPFDLSATILT